MKQFLLLMGAALFISGNTFGQILTFENSGLAGNEVSTTSNTNDSNIGSSTLSRGTGINASNNGGRFNANSHSTEATLVSGDNSYFTFNITPNSGFSFSITSIEFNFQRSSTGPKAFALRSSNDSFASDLGTAVTISDVTSTQTLTFTFGLSDITSDTEFRLYTYNAESTSGSGGIGDGSGNDITVNGTTQSTGGSPTKFVITSVNSGSSATSGTGFDVVVELQDSGDSPTVATQDTSVTLTLASGSGSLGGTLTGTISSGNSTVTISGVTYNTTESGVTITATNTGGSLTAGTSSAFEVLGAPTKLVISGFPSGGFTGVDIDEFTVQVQRADNSVDLNSTASIAIAKASGSGALTATSPVAAVEGVATFSDVSFDAADDYTVTFTSAGLTSATSGTVSVITVNSSPAVGDVYITEYSDASAFENEFVEFYNASSQAVDIDGYVLRQQNATGDYTFSGSTIIEANGFLILGRNNDKSTFESEWGSLPSNVTYINSGDDLPQINGAEVYLLENGSGINVDPATDDEYSAQAVSSNGKVYRAYLNGNTSSDWITGSRSDATPGVLDAAVTISGDAGWRLLSIPKTGATPADISDDGIGAQFTSNTDSATIYTYDDTGSFEAITSSSTTLTDGHGLAVYFFDNAIAGSSTLPITLDVSGSEPSSDVVVDLYSGAIGRYTLVGNPFATNIDVADVGANIAISSNMTFWDNTAGSYTTENISGGLVIQPWQGYWVQTGSSDAGGQLTFGIIDKTITVADTTHFDKANPNTVKELKFTIESSYNTEKNLTLQVADDASEGWDSYDLIKLGSLLPRNVSAAFVGDLNGEPILKGIEAIPSSLEREITLPIMVDLKGDSQTLNMSWEGLSELPGTWSITLHDYVTEQSFDLRSTDDYEFEVVIDGANEKINPVTVLRSSLGQHMKLKSNLNPRFGLTIIPSNTSVSNEIETEVSAFELDQNYPNPFNPTTTINYSVENSGAVTISVYNLMGQKVAELVNETKASGSYNVTWNASQAASGMYYYRLEAGGQTLTRKMTLIK